MAINQKDLMMVSTAAAQAGAALTRVGETINGLNLALGELRIQAQRLEDERDAALLEAERLADALGAAGVPDPIVTAIAKGE